MLRPRRKYIVLITLLGLPFRALTDRKTNLVARYLSMRILEPHLQRAGYFAVLGVNAAMGRTFDPHDTSPGSKGEVIISDGLWKRAFGADPHMVGKSLRLDKDEFQIVGVMPAGYRDQGQTSEERGTELWASDGFSDAQAPSLSRGTRLQYQTIARLQPGFSLEVAQAMPWLHR
jgi:hypothetical protein